MSLTSALASSQADTLFSHDHVKSRFSASPGARPNHDANNALARWKATLPDIRDGDC
jgi:hypothetical protein